MTALLVEIKGWNGGTVYYAPDEKHLYCRKDGYKGTSYLVCYEAVASKGKKKRDKIQCPARRHLDEKTGKVSCTQSQHGNHENHEIMYRDLISLNAMKDRCRYLAENFPGCAHRISVKGIFLRELSKYVLYIIPNLEFLRFPMFELN